MPARRSTTTRASVKPGTPLPKGARIPQPALVISIVRSLFIGALLLFLASPFLLAWARDQQPTATPAGQHAGLLTSLLPTQRAPIPTTSSPPEHVQAEDRIALDAPEHRDLVAPMIARLVSAV